MSNQKKNTKFDDMKNAILNNPIVALIVLVGVIITAVAAFIVNVEKGTDVVKEYLPNDEFVIEGSVITEVGSKPPSNITVTVFWVVYYLKAPAPNDSGSGSSSWGTTLYSSDSAFQDSRISTIDPSTGRLDYKITLDQPPDERMMTNFDGVKLGVGYLGAFNDENINGIYEPEEEIIAAAPDRAVTYLDGDIQSVDIPPEGSQRSDQLYTLQELPQGYSLVEAVPPEVHHLPVPYYDLVPIQPELINLVIPKNKFVDFPYWFSGLWSVPEIGP